MVLFDTTFGKVFARVVFDHQQIHFGSSTPITGRIHVKFQPRTHDVHELFGPMRIDILLEGSSNTSIHVSEKNNSSSTYRGKAGLVLQGTVAFDGPVRLLALQEQSFPFAICFPERVQKGLPRDQFDAEEDQFFNMAPDQPLPPSLPSAWSTKVRGRMMTDGWIEYRLRSLVSMPHIDVRCSSYGEEHGGHLLLYEQPLVPSTGVANASMPTQYHELRVSNEFLLPESQRPVGFLAKTKAFLDSNAYPAFHARVTIDGAANLQLGQSMHFRVCMQPDYERSTVSEVPQIELKYFWVHINGFTQIRAEALFRSNRYKDGSSRLATFAGSSDRPWWLKANDYTNVIHTHALASVSSTFSTFNITRNYTLDLEIVLIIAQKEVKVKCKGIPVRVLPPQVAPLPMAGPPDHAVLPSYTPRGGPSGSRAAPPDYESQFADASVVAAREKS